MQRIIIAIVLLTLPGCSVVATKDIDQAIGLATRASDARGLACLNSMKVIFSVEPIGMFTVMEQAKLMQIALDTCAGMIPAVQP